VRNTWPACGQLAAQLAKVVDLAVEDHGDRAVGGEERLATAFEVDHLQAAMTEADEPVEMEAVGIRPAMRERGGHRR
jgi:hypothetical protein